MPISKDRRFAKLWRAYERVEAELARVRKQRDVALEDLGDAHRLHKQTQKAFREVEEELADTDAHTIAMLEYCASRLHLAGSRNAGDKVDRWIGEIKNAQAIRHQQASRGAPLRSLQLTQGQDDPNSVEPATGDASA